MEEKMELSKELDFEFKFKDGNVVLIVSYEGKGFKSSFANELKSEYFLDKLAEAIPGTLDDMVIEGLKQAIK